MARSKSELLKNESQTITLMEQLCQGFAKIVEEFQELHGLRFPTNGEKRRKVYLKDIIAATIKAFKANDEEWQKMIPA